MASFLTAGKRRTLSLSFSFCMCMFRLYSSLSPPIYLRMLCALVCLLRCVCAFWCTVPISFLSFWRFFLSTSSLYLSRALHCIVRFTKYTHNTKKRTKFISARVQCEFVYIVGCVQTFQYFIYIYMYTYISIGCVCVLVLSFSFSPIEFIFEFRFCAITV